MSKETSDEIMKARVTQVEAQAAAEPVDPTKNSFGNLTYARGRKVSDGNYGSHEFFVAYSSSVGLDQDKKAIMKELVEYVEQVLAYKLSLVGTELDKIK